MRTHRAEAPRKQKFSDRNLPLSKLTMARCEAAPRRGGCARDRRYYLSPAQPWPGVTAVSHSAAKKKARARAGLFAYSGIT